MLRTGFIGVGSQGGPMAHRMVDAGFDLTVWARRAEATAPYVAKGAVAAASVADLGAACDHVGICVVTDDDVIQICDTLIPAMKPGSRIAIHSTVLPESCAMLAARAAERGIALIDAPVSGGGPGAEAGTLTVMCGGEPATFEACRPVFESFGRLIVHLGPIGAGQRAKIINNALLAANMGLAQAACDAAAAQDIDAAAFRELVCASSGNSFGFGVYARLPSPAAFAIGAPLLVKDVRLLGSILPVHAGTALLRDAAAPFLHAATGDNVKE
jgi:3-hydroxyisobutyrate dehydrogenase